MRKFKKSLAVILAIVLCASFCTTSVYADEIHPSLNKKELYPEETISEVEVSEETCEEEKNSEKEVSEEISDSEELDIVDSEEPASEDDFETVETSVSVHADETEEDTETFGATSYKVGDIIKFGHYEQDGNMANGKEEIEWEVLKVESDRVLVVSKCGLDCVAYDKNNNAVTWESCSLRSWLNNNFKNEAFTLEEQAKIPVVTVVNEDNSFCGTEGGNDTQDYLFCLSLSEIRDLIGYNFYDNEYGRGYSQKLIVEPTTYAMNKGFKVGRFIDEEEYNRVFKQYGYTPDVVGRKGCDWWLRSPGGGPRFACLVSYNGKAGPNEYEGVDGIAFVSFIVRPAMYLTIQNVPDTTNIFADVREGTWQYNAAIAVYDKGYMNGKGKSGDKIIFAPNTPITRVEFVQVLYNAEKRPNTVYKQQFSDVKINDWFASSVTWAAKNQIVAGNGNGTFGVTGNATREQLALMFYKYATFKGYDTAVNLETGKTVDNFPDANVASIWAKNALNWAISCGILSGTGAGKLNPKGNATRIECAAMIRNFQNAYSEETPKSEFDKKIEELRNKFPQGKYWNHKVDSSKHDAYNWTNDGCNNYDGYTDEPCHYHGVAVYENGVADCNWFDGASQCQGFARKLYYDVYGELASGRLIYDYNKDNIKAGDVLTYRGNMFTGGNWVPTDYTHGHTVFVIERNGDTIKVAECNADNQCGIFWDREINLNNSTEITDIICVCRHTN